MLVVSIRSSFDVQNHIFPVMSHSHNILTSVQKGIEICAISTRCRYRPTSERAVSSHRKGSSIIAGVIIALVDIRRAIMARNGAKDENTAFSNWTVLNASLQYNDDLAQFDMIATEGRCLVATEGHCLV